MIKEIDNIALINSFLKNFDTKIEKKGVFSKYCFYYFDGKPIGFINYDIIYERVELNYIFIIDEYRGKNYASSLIKYMIDDCINNHCVNISLEVRDDSETAINLYKKFDFKEVATRKNYYKNNDGILMIKEM